jgi:hypothetical protein
MLMVGMFLSFPLELLCEPAPQLGLGNFVSHLIMRLREKICLGQKRYFLTMAHLVQMPGCDELPKTNSKICIAAD